MKEKKGSIGQLNFGHHQLKKNKMLDKSTEFQSLLVQNLVIMQQLKKPTKKRVDRSIEFQSPPVH
jgi:hypothetical protein